MDFGKHRSRREDYNYSRRAPEADSDGGDRKRWRRCEENRKSEAAVMVVQEWLEMRTKKASTLDMEIDGREGPNGKDDVAVYELNKSSDLDANDEFMKKTKAEEVSIVDHSKIEYLPFRKSFYVEVEDTSMATHKEVRAFREWSDHNINGNGVPLLRPLKAWDQSGLATEILDALKYYKPTPIQAEALPAIMSGRDFIGIAKPGSGKTLAFVLPMLTHVKDQPPAVSGDGPIALVMAPTRELVEQIHRDISVFAPAAGIRCMAVYGVARQTEAEVVVCTPGTMVDILYAKMMNLRRVSYLVLDGADQLFEMGFEPQMTRIVKNIQPGRQTLVFSATLPRQLENWAKKVTITPVELRVADQVVVNKDIAQMVEVLLPESRRMSRLEEIISESYGKEQILVFFQSSQDCSRLLSYLYPYPPLHVLANKGDRPWVIPDYKSGACKLMFAVGSLAESVPVKDLGLVINYDVPTCYRDYVRQVGRTRRGRALTFISDEDYEYAPYLLKSLELSEQAVPDDLKGLAEGSLTGSLRISLYREYYLRGREWYSDKEIVKKVAPGMVAVEAELEINDFPQYVRWMVTCKKKTLEPISDLTGADITTMGQFYPSESVMHPTDRKLYLLIRGPTEHSVERAKAELNRALEDFTKWANHIHQGYINALKKRKGKISIFVSN